MAPSPAQKARTSPRVPRYSLGGAATAATVSRARVEKTREISFFPGVGVDRHQVDQVLALDEVDDEVAY
jgi:hypothetical protein